MAATWVCAGLLSPADNYIEAPVDISQLLVGNAATFLWRVQGWTMRDRGSTTGDILIVDRSLDPVDSDVAVANVESEFTVKRFKRPAPGALARFANVGRRQLRHDPDRSPRRDAARSGGGRRDGPGR